MKAHKDNGRSQKLTLSLCDRWAKKKHNVSKCIEILLQVKLKEFIVLTETQQTK
jgi:hypothetical protein